jgi:hypothetical protein
MGQGLILGSEEHDISGHVDPVSWLAEDGKMAKAAGSATVVISSPQCIE